MSDHRPWRPCWPRRRLLLVLLGLKGNGGFLDGSGSTFSLWLGLGVGLVVLARTPRDARS
jgi:hypothetical protein